MFRNIFYIFTMVAMGLYCSISLAFSQQSNFQDRSWSGNKTLDYDNVSPRESDPSWYSFGCQWVHYDDDERLVFHVKKNIGFFKKIRVKVGSSQPYFIRAKVFSRGGVRKKFNIASNKSFPGQAVEVKFSYKPKEIRRIVLRYDARMRAGDKTKICVGGQKINQGGRERYLSENKPRLPPFQKNRTSQNGWARLGCVKVGKKFTNDYLQVKAGQGRFEAIRLFVKNAPAIINRLEVGYKNGTTQSFRLKRQHKVGVNSKAFYLRKRSRLSVLDIKARSRSLFQQAKICFEGLQVGSDVADGFERKFQENDKSPSFSDPTERRFAQRDKNQEKRSETELDSYIESAKKQRDAAKKRAEQKRREQDREAQKRADKERAQKEVQAQSEARNAARRRAEAEVKKLQRQKMSPQNTPSKQGNLGQGNLERNNLEAKKQRAEAALKAIEQQKRKKEAEAKALAERARAKEQARKADLEAQKLTQEEAKAKALSDQAERARLEAQKQVELLEERERVEAEAEAKAAIAAAEVEKRMQALKEKQRLALLKKKAAEELAKKNKVHSKEAAFPKFKISPEKSRGWISYGCQEFGSKIEERYVPVGRLQGTFTKIRVKASQNSLTLKKMIVVYGNGQEEPLIRYSSRVKIGERTSDYKLSHKRRFISEVKLKGKARDSGNEQKTRVCLEAFR